MCLDRKHRKLHISSSSSSSVEHDTSEGASSTDQHLSSNLFSSTAKSCASDTELKVPATASLQPVKSVDQKDSDVGVPERIVLKLFSPDKKVQSKVKKSISLKRDSSGKRHGANTVHKDADSPSREPVQFRKLSTGKEYTVKSHKPQSKLKKVISNEKRNDSSKNVDTKTRAVDNNTGLPLDKPTGFKKSSLDQGGIVASALKPQSKMKKHDGAKRDEHRVKHSGNTKIWATDTNADRSLNQPAECKKLSPGEGRIEQMKTVVSKPTTEVKQESRPSGVFSPLSERLGRIPKQAEWLMNATKTSVPKLEKTTNVAQMPKEATRAPHSGLHSKHKQHHRSLSDRRPTTHFQQKGNSSMLATTHSTSHSSQHMKISSEQEHTRDRQVPHVSDTERMMAANLPSASLQPVNRQGSTVDVLERVVPPHKKLQSEVKKHAGIKRESIVERGSDNTKSEPAEFRKSSDFMLKSEKPLSKPTKNAISDKKRHRSNEYINTKIVGLDKGTGLLLNKPTGFKKSSDKDGLLTSALKPQTGANDALQTEEFKCSVPSSKIKRNVGSNEERLGMEIKAVDENIKLPLNKSAEFKKSSPEFTDNNGIVTSDFANYYRPHPGYLHLQKHAGESLEYRADPVAAHTTSIVPAQKPASKVVSLSEYKKRKSDSKSTAAECTSGLTKSNQDDLPPYMTSSLAEQLIMSYTKCSETAGYNLSEHKPLPKPVHSYRALSIRQNDVPCDKLTSFGDVCNVQSDQSARHDPRLLPKPLNSIPAATVKQNNDQSDKDLSPVDDVSLGDGIFHDTEQQREAAVFDGAPSRTTRDTTDDHMHSSDCHSCQDVSDQLHADNFPGNSIACPGPPNYDRNAAEAVTTSSYGVSVSVDVSVKTGLYEKSSSLCGIAVGDLETVVSDSRSCHDTDTDKVRKSYSQLDDDSKLAHDLPTIVSSYKITSKLCEAVPSNDVAVLGNEQLEESKTTFSDDKQEEWAFMTNKNEPFSDLSAPSGDTVLTIPFTVLSHTEDPYVNDRNKSQFVSVHTGDSTAESELKVSQNELSASESAMNLDSESLPVPEHSNKETDILAANAVLLVPNKHEEQGQLMEHASENSVNRENIRTVTDVNFRQATSGLTDLMVAASQGCLDLVRQLLACKAYVDVEDACGESALVKAARGGHVDVVKELLDHGANVSMSLIAAPSVPQYVKELLEKHLIAVTEAFEPELCDVLAGVGSLRRRIFPVHCVSLSDAKAHNFSFKYNASSAVPGKFVFLFVALGDVRCENVQCGLFDWSVIEHIKLNGQLQQSLHEHIDSVYRLIAIREGSNRLVVHTKSIAPEHMQYKLLMGAYEVVLRAVA